MISPRPPEPHAGGGIHLKQQLVGFSMASERRRRVPLSEMSGFAGRNGTNNGTTCRGRPWASPTPPLGCLSPRLSLGAAHAHGEPLFGWFAAADVRRQ